MRKTGKFILLATFLVLALSSVSLAQSAADKSWNAFWTKFSAAAKAKNVSAILKLTASEKDFFGGGGAGNRKQIIKESLNYIKDSAKTGTKPHNEGNRPARITKDNTLIFEYFNKSWWFVGFMGD